MPGPNDTGPNDTANTSLLGNGNNTFQASGSVNRDIKMIPFVPEADPLVNGPKWEKWMDEFDTRLRYFRVTDDQDKLDALKIYGGKEIRDKIKLLRDPEPDSDDSSDTELQASVTPYGKALAKLNKHYIGLKSVPHARFRFGKLRQKDGETINEYEVRLREAARDCEFLDIDGQILYHLSLTIKDSDFRRKAMDKKYSLQKFLLKAQSKEDTYRRAEEIEANDERAINRVQSYKPRPNHQRNQHRSTSHKHQQPAQHGYSRHKPDDCPHCNVDHTPGRWNCPASGVKCDNCGGKGHYAIKCLKPKRHTQNSFNNRKPNNYSNKHCHTHTKQITQESETDEESVYKIHKHNHNKYSPLVKIYVNNVKVQFEIDTGASSNLIDEDRFYKIQNKLDSKSKLELHPTNVKLLTYGDYMIPVIGYFETTVTSKQNKTLTAKFLVVKGSVRSSPLLSLQTSVDLGLISFNYQVQATLEKPSEDIDSILLQYNDIFTGLGQHTKYEASFIVDDTIIPTIQKQRKVAYNLEAMALQEEKRLMDNDIIEDVPTTEPTTWCTNPVITTKPHNPDKIRYCVNMRPVNQAIKRPITEAQTVEDIAFKLNGSKVYSKLDMNESYHQIKLSESSRHLTTFYGVNGKKRYKRLNYGAISSQDIFDDIMYKTVGDLPGVINIRDDIICFGSNVENHDTALKSVLQRFRECGLTLNKSKCQFRSTEIDFFGFKFSSAGMKPDPKKIETIENLERPKTVSEIRSFLSMLAFSSRFIPKFSAISTPLRKLTEKNAVMKWGPEEEQAFNQLKSSLTKDLTLTYYNTKLKTRVYVDAGPTGIAAMLAQLENQVWHPVLFVSRSLTKVEQRYSQIEREALGARWACEKLYMYIIGSKFELITDHQPLLPLFNNPNSRPPIRIERWLLYLQQFDFILIYEKGKFNPADYLSRHPVPHNDTDRSIYKHSEETVRAIIRQCSLPAVSLKDIHNETDNDKTLIKLREYIKTSNHHMCKTDDDTKQYATIFHELSLIDDIILRGDKVLVPKKLQRKVVELSHEGHQGITLTKQLLRSKVWFPLIDKMVETEIKNCIPCQAAVPEHNRDPLVMSILPNHPWERICVDFCGPFPTGEYALVIIDEYSRYPIVEIVTSTSFKVVKPCFEKIFSLFGIPKSVKSDNGPPFNSQEFKQYLIDRGSRHSPVTPLWPEANGMAERFMKPLVKFAQTVNIEGGDWRMEIHSFLANYRSTPRSTTGKSPYQLMFKRSVITKLPTFEVNTPENLEVLAKDTAKKEEIKEYADKKRHVSNHKIIVGNPVLVKTKKKCKLSTPYDPQPYIVCRVKGTMITATRISDGKSITRNASHFKLLEIPMRSVIMMSDKQSPRTNTNEDLENTIENELRNQEMLLQNNNKYVNQKSSDNSVLNDTKVKVPNNVFQKEIQNHSDISVSENNQSRCESQITSSQSNSNSSENTNTNNNNTIRRSTRVRKQPVKYDDYVMYDK